MANGEFWRESKNPCPAPPSHPPREQPTSPRPQEHGGHGDINFYIWDINLPGNHPGEQISSLHYISINNTTNCSNEPVRVRPNPRPQKGVVWFGLVWFRKSKRNNKPNHKQFIIHESIKAQQQDELSYYGNSRLFLLASPPNRTILKRYHKQFIIHKSINTHI